MKRKWGYSTWRLCTHRTHRCTNARAACTPVLDGSPFLSFFFFHSRTPTLLRVSSSTFPSSASAASASVTEHFVYDPLAPCSLSPPAWHFAFPRVFGTFHNYFFAEGCYPPKTTACSEISGIRVHLNSFQDLQPRSPKSRVYTKIRLSAKNTTHHSHRIHSLSSIVHTRN